MLRGWSLSPEGERNKLSQPNWVLHFVEGDQFFFSSLDGKLSLCKFSTLKISIYFPPKSSTRQQHTRLIKVSSSSSLPPARCLANTSASPVVLGVVVVIFDSLESILEAIDASRVVEFSSTFSLAYCVVSDMVVNFLYSPEYKLDIIPQIC